MLRRIAIAVAFLFATLILAEGILRALPVSTATMTGYYFHPDLLTYPSRHEWTVATGWDLRNPQRLRANNWGFAADVDFVRDADAVALIGDSYVEASMLDADDRPAAQLQAMLMNGRKVFGMGSPGTALLDYAQRIGVAYREFDIRTFAVLLEPGDARQSLCGSGNVHSRCLDRSTLEPRVERIAPPGVAKQLLRQSALAQYVFSQLKLDPSRLVAGAFSRTVPTDPATTANVTANPPYSSLTLPTPESKRVVDAVVDRFGAEVWGLPGARIVFVVDGRARQADSISYELERERNYLIWKLSSLGYEVIDLQPVFRAHARQSKLSLDVGPFDRHLNSLGVRLAMTELAAALNAPGRKP